jgi:DNA-binding CsgD family transcriptional regulator
LRNTLAWSYDLLDAAEQNLFRGLAVFAGGCTLEAIEAVCRRKVQTSAVARQPSETDILPVVGSLVDKSLLRKEDGARNEPRFVMLETIQEYAGELLEASGEADELHERHARYFSALAAEIEPRLKAVEQKQWLDRLEADHDNFRAALARSLDRQDVDTALRLAGHMGWFWFVRSHFSEGVAWSVAALRLAEAKARGEIGDAVGERTAAHESRKVLLAKGLWAAGMLATWQGHGAYAVPRAYLEQSAALARQMADQPLLADVLLQLGNVLNFERDYAGARARFEESLTAARAANYTWAIANALDRLGSANADPGDTALRGTRRQESLALRLQLGDRRGIAISFVNLGEMARAEGDYAGACRWYEQALPILHELGSTLNVAVTLSNLGCVLFHLGDGVRATHFLSEALALARDLNSEALTHLALAGLAGPIAAQAGAAGAARAARLLGAAAALQDVTGDFLEPIDRADFDANAARARAKLGEQAFAAAWAEGRAMSMDQAIAHALESVAEPAEGFTSATSSDPTPRPEPRASQAEPALQQLTRRELEVLRLVAEGLTTPQVAERLVLSVRTVENHLRSIYGKLNVSTRAAATRIAVEHGLLND